MSISLWKARSVTRPASFAARHAGLQRDRRPQAGDVRVRSHTAINGMQVVTVAPVVEEAGDQQPAFIMPAAPAAPSLTVAAPMPAPVMSAPAPAVPAPQPRSIPATAQAQTWTAAADMSAGQPMAYPASAVARVRQHRTTKAVPAQYAMAEGADIPPRASMAVPVQASFAGAAEAILSLRPRSQRTQFDDAVTQVAHRHRIDPLLLHAVMLQESGYRPRIVSHAGAVGLMQIMPGTGALLGVQRQHLTVPMVNIDAGARLLRRLAEKYNNSFDLVLAAYNAGEGAVAKYGNRVPPYRETQDYVRRVMANYYRFAGEAGLMAQR